MRIKETVIPENRPTYRQWVKDMKIGGGAYLTDPDGKQKADRIMEGVGVHRFPTKFERIFMPI